MPTVTVEERVGTTIAGRYKISGIIGKGGMAVVYRAEHAWTAREVALKMLLAQYAQNAEIVRRFLAEARAAAKLKHMHVVDVLDMGTADDDSAFIALELLEGEPVAPAQQAIDGRRVAERIPAEPAAAHLGLAAE